MNTYHKIQTIYKRDPANRNRTLLEGQFSIPEFEYLQRNEWVFTEKVDGTNIRVIITPEGKIEFKGKTDTAQIPATLVQRLIDIFHPQAESLAGAFPSGGCLYGEGFGPKIQKGGGNYGKEQDFVLFDVKVPAGEDDHVDSWWLQREAVESVADNCHVPVVPIVGRGTLHDMISHAKAGIQSTWGNFAAEGYVARPAIELFARNGDRIITKIKTKDFPAT